MNDYKEVLQRDIEETRRTVQGCMLGIVISSFLWAGIVGIILLIFN